MKAILLLLALILVFTQSQTTPRDTLIQDIKNYNGLVQNFEADVKRWEEAKKTLNSSYANIQRLKKQYYDSQTSTDRINNQTERTKQQTIATTKLNDANSAIGTWNTQVGKLTNDLNILKTRRATLLGTRNSLVQRRTNLQ